MKGKTILAIFVLISLVSFVAAQGTIENLGFVNPLEDFVAGSEINFSFSFNYEHLNGISPIIIFVNVSSNDSNFPVWKNDFDLKGTMKVDNGFFPDEYFDFECYEDSNELENDLGIETEINPGEFYCSDLELLTQEVDSSNEVEINVKSNPALWPGKYNFTIGLYYDDSIIVPINLQVYSPENKIYNNRRLGFNLTTDLEVQEIEYIDWNDRIPRWRRLCRDCNEYGNERTRLKSFRDGEHNITIRATDYSMDVEEKNIEFFIDSRNPRISRTEPRRGFANGNFYLEFIEENPKNLTLYYGLNGEKTKEFDLENCVEERRGYSCEEFVDLDEFDGEEIVYWFVLEDIAGNVDESREEQVSVDNTAPLINSLEYFKERRSYYVELDIDEINFDEVTYIDLNDSRARERRLCSRLRDGICEGRLSLDDGQHVIEIYVKDEAGNIAVASLEFFSDTKNPRISKTEPRRGFSQGHFEIEFIEENPKNLTLYYGDDSYELNIEEECYEERRGFSCNTYVDLSKYDGEEIRYYFVLKDIVGNQDQSREQEISVDLTAPVLNEFNYEINRGVEFYFNITELNFDEINYEYIDFLGRLRERRLCSRLRDGICETRKYFREGEYNITINILDEAENKISFPLEFSIS